MFESQFFSVFATGGSPLDFLQYGALGLVIVALLLGWLWAKPAVDRLIADKEKSEAQRDKVLDVFEQKLVPALTESTTVLTAMKPLMEELVRLLDDDDYVPKPRQRRVKDA